MGPITSLIADMQTIHETRPLPDGSGRGVVENEDAAAVLLRFANGAQGSLVISRSAWGRKSRLGFEVHGTKGMIVFDQERMNELQVFSRKDRRDAQGYRTLLAAPAHAPYQHFIPALRIIIHVLIKLHNIPLKASCSPPGKVFSIGGTNV